MAVSGLAFSHPGHARLTRSQPGQRGQGLGCPLPRPPWGRRRGAACDRTKANATRPREQRVPALPSGRALQDCALHLLASRCQCRLSARTRGTPAQLRHQHPRGTGSAALGASGWGGASLGRSCLYNGTFLFALSKFTARFFLF